MSRILKTGAALVLAGMFFCGHASSVQASLKKNDIIVFLGDSITEEGVLPHGFITLTAQRISRLYPDLNIKLIGAGIGGHRVPDCKKRLDRDVLRKKPTIVLIYIGINDVWHWKIFGRGTPRKKFESGLRYMIEKINRAGVRVILCTPTVIGEKVDGTNPLDKILDEYSDISRRVAKDTGAQLLDLRRAFMDYLKKHNTGNTERGVLTRDSIHLNRNGDRFLADLVFDALNVFDSQ